MSPDVAARLVRLVAWLVPAHERDVWRREWIAELTYAARRGGPTGRRPVAGLTAAVAHAIWLRVDEWSLGTLGQDLRHAARRLVRRPGFSVTVLATVALGIGASTSIYGAARAVFWRPLPYPNADRLVMLGEQTPEAQQPGIDGSVSVPDFEDWRRMSTTLSDLGAAKLAGGALTGAGTAEQLVDSAATSGFFRALGVPALYGRTFQPDDDVPGGPDEAILGFDLWQRRFGADPGIIGRSIQLAGAPRLVVGVMPRGVRLPLLADLWVPLRIDPAGQTADRDVRRMMVIGRLPAGVSLEAALRRLEGVAAQLALDYPATNRHVSVTAVTLRDALVGDTKPALSVLLAGVLLVLLIGCVNIASLTLGSAFDRERELAVRAALGAGRTRLLRAVALESAILAGVGGIIGVGLAVLGLRSIAALPLATVPFLANTQLDSRTILFGGLLTLATALLSSAVPAWRAAGRDLMAGVQAQGGRATTGATARRLRRLLVTAELALAMALLVAAGLLTRSFLKLTSVDLGLDLEDVHAFDVSVSTRAYDSTARQTAFLEDLIARLKARPEVAAVGGVFGLPLEQFDYHYAVEARDGRPLLATPSDAVLPMQLRIVTPGYFRALGIRILAGRALTDEDRHGATPVALVNANAAARLWPGQSPLGHRLTLARLHEDGTGAGGEIVGLVGDVHDFGPSEPVQPTVYVPFRQVPIDVLTVVVKARERGADLEPLARAIVAGLDPDVPVNRSRTLTSVADGLVVVRRLDMIVLGLFGLAAISLAATGVFGVVAQDVTARTREIGVRVALGATRAQVLRLVVGQAGQLAGLGILIGLGLAAIGARLTSGLLFEVHPADVATYATATTLTLAVALAAAWVPGRRAARVDPVSAVRAE